MATVSVMSKGCIVTRVLPLRCFLFLLPNFIHVMQLVNIATGILPTPNTSLSSLPVGSKYDEYLCIALLKL